MLHFNVGTLPQAREAGPGQHMPICEEKQEQRARKTLFKPLRCKISCEGPIRAQWTVLRDSQDQESVLTGRFSMLHQLTSAGGSLVPLLVLLYPNFF